VGERRGFCSKEFFEGGLAGLGVVCKLYVLFGCVAA